MIPEEIYKIDKKAVIFIVEHEILHRLMKIEPGCIAIDDRTGKGSVFTTTDEGKFLSQLLETLNAMRDPQE